jgi:hypothetical protein
MLGGLEWLALRDDGDGPEDMRLGIVPGCEGLRYSNLELERWLP